MSSTHLRLDRHAYPIAKRFVSLCAASTLLVVGLTTSLAAQSATPALLLFGGSNHETFLGCLNCGRYDAASICNKYGDFGSRFNNKSIWNRYGDFGSRYSDSSPWNKYASNPPIIVDQQGNSYGYFTSNRTKTSRTTIKPLLVFLDNVDQVNEDLEVARDTFCGS